MDFRAGRPHARHERRKEGGQLLHGQTDRRQAALAVIRWTNKTGTESVGAPLPHAHARALLQAFQAHFPLLEFWLETPPALNDAIRYPPGGKDVGV